jgi:PAS domain S-box-containing protein
MVEHLLGRWGGTARVGVRLTAAAFLTSGAFLLTLPLLKSDPDLALWVALASAAVAAFTWGPGAGLVGALVGLGAVRYALPLPILSIDIADPATDARIAASAVVVAIVLIGIRRERRAVRRSLTALAEAREAFSAAAAASAESARSSALLETLFATAPAGLAYVDAERRFSRVNAAFAELLGVPVERLVNRSASELPPSVDEVLRPWLDKALEGELTSGMPLQFAGRDGRTTRYVVASFYPLPTDAAPTEAGIVLQDVTALRSAERRLRQAQRMEAIGRVAGGVAHELNNQLTVVLGHSDLLRRQVGEGRRGGLDLDAITQAASRAAQVIGQLLAFTRQQVLQPRPMRLDMFLVEVSPELAEALGPEVDLLVRPDPAVRWVVADAEQLTQALVHVASNARDAMPNGGRLLIGTEAVEVSSSESPEDPGVQVRPGRYARITISDCGVGMPPHVRGRAFEPFFTTKAAIDGNGLGLSFVYGVVKQLGGYVWIDSTPGAGTTVRIDLPWASEAAGLPEVVVAVAQGPVPAESGMRASSGRQRLPRQATNA